MAIQKHNPTSLGTTNVADLLERVLDKGVVIAGDVKVKLLDIELLTIQLRLVVCSVDKAKEMGLDWWANTSAFCGAEEHAVIDEQPVAAALPGADASGEVIAQSGSLDERMRALEEELTRLREEARSTGATIVDEQQDVQTNEGPKPL